MSDVTHEEHVVSVRLRSTVRLAVTAATSLALAATGAGLATAATTAATTSVNVRSGPGTSHTVLAELVRGQRISTAGKASGGWTAVELGGTRAYMASRYLKGGRAMPAAPRRISTSGTKILTETVNVRSGPSTSRSVVGSLAEGRRITLTGKQSAGFAQTRYEGRLRWVSVAYLAASRHGGSTATPSPSPTPSPSSKAATAVAFAKRQLGKPYRFGAAGPSSYDCSGLMLAAWHAAGVNLPRTSQQQYAHGHRVAKSQLRAGDLVFFYSQSPSHVGLYVGNGMVIHAPRPGRSVEYIKMSYMPYAGAVRPA